MKDFNNLLKKLKTDKVNKKLWIFSINLKQPIKMKKLMKPSVLYFYDSST